MARTKIPTFKIDEEGQRAQAAWASEVLMNGLQAQRQAAGKADCYRVGGDFRTAREALIIRDSDLDEVRTAAAGQLLREALEWLSGSSR